VAVDSAARKALAGLRASVREAAPFEGVLGVQPAFVVGPSSVQEAAEAIRTAAEHGLTVVPRGGETRLDWGAPPTSCDILLDTEGLDRVIEHAAGDLIVKVEAGVQMSDLAVTLAAQHQQLALDTPLPGSTVGGTLATGACGPRRFRYGSPRELLIGMTIIRPDGTIAHSGGKVVKNVAGYDLGKLFTGSYGTLGLIAEAAFRLHPIPAAQAYLTSTHPTVEAATRAARAAAHSLAVPTAIELDIPAEGPVTLTVLLEGAETAMPSRTQALSSATPAKEPPAWWAAYPEGTTLIATMSDDPPSAQAGSRDLRALGGNVRWSPGRHGHVALPAETSPEEVAAVLAGLRTRGSAVVRYAPEAVREAVDLWGPVQALPLMRRVKDQFDPGHRMSPGRYIT
jgi:glycolate oxidase FAD binding subunit